MFFLESLSQVEVNYRLSFQAGETIKSKWGGQEQHNIFRFLGGPNCFHFSQVETYDREMVRDYCVNDREI